MSDQNPVTLERNGPIAIVTLHRPAVRNAISAAMAEAIENFVHEIETDPSLRVAILAAKGPIFCAGADLAEVAAGRGMSLARPDTGFAGFVDAKRTKPWIAAVQGPAHGGGVEITLSCDMVVAAETASFTLPEVRRGLIAGANGSFRIARYLPRPLAIEMLIVGHPLPASRAHALGMVNSLVPTADDVLPEALRLAQLVAANSPLAVRESLRVVRAAADQGEQDLRALQADAVGIVLAGPDVKEGASAFIEKRQPEWRT
ncbi:enoyl-CoA hydratase-related protein [Niveispirillum sp.]|uniref:enoyl-CoA hydratase-related protein n=1 Tax=Niveispirillum sp. TaxID=1917217 RepID=UPI001B70680C|nr:enoyl-CoA hydratase-related protein [Niveispirillum sp.]MBP7337085.1 enoyl-CoA hydratase/isomerase family protein [Niveispirillum sp.]